MDRGGKNFAGIVLYADSAHNAQEGLDNVFSLRYVLSIIPGESAIESGHRLLLPGTTSILQVLTEKTEIVAYTRDGLRVKHVLAVKAWYAVESVASKLHLGVCEDQKTPR